MRPLEIGRMADNQIEKVMAPALGRAFEKLDTDDQDEIDDLVDGLKTYFNATTFDALHTLAKIGLLILDTEE